VNSIVAWRIGAVLLLIGGVLAGIASAIVPVHGVGLDVVMSNAEMDSVRIASIVSISADAGLGLGLILAGVGIRRRYPACWLLMVAGGAWLLRAIVRGAGFMVFVPFVAFDVLAFVTVITLWAAGIAMVTRSGLPLIARWILLVLALGVAVTAVETVVPDLRGDFRPLHDGTAWVLRIVDVLPAVIGLVWLTVREPRGPAPLPAQPNVNERAAGPGIRSIERVPSGEDALDRERAQDAG